jgi:DNA-binding transcriptional LysR family regulator
LQTTIFLMLDLDVGMKRFIGMTQPWDFEGGCLLEQGLGVRLVHRSTLAVTLTGEGEEVIRSARQLLDATTDVRMRHKRADDAYE